MIRKEISKVDGLGVSGGQVSNRPEGGSDAAPSQDNSQSWKHFADALASLISCAALSPEARSGYIRSSHWELRLHGFSFVFFDDCGQLDYLDHVQLPTGETVAYEDLTSRWPEPFDLVADAEVDLLQARMLSDGAVRNAARVKGSTRERFRPPAVSGGGTASGWVWVIEPNDFPTNRFVFGVAADVPAAVALIKERYVDGPHVVEWGDAFKCDDDEWRLVGKFPVIKGGSAGETEEWLISRFPLAASKADK